MSLPGAFRRKPNFALSLQVYKTNNIFLFFKLYKLNVKSCSEIVRVNKPNVCVLRSIYKSDFALR